MSPWWLLAAFAAGVWVARWWERAAARARLIEALDDGDLPYDDVLKLANAAGVSR